MAKIEIYTTQFCPFCWRAKALLDKKGAAYEEVSVDGKRDLRAAMTERAGGSHTVPQIFIDNRHVGGCDELYSLDRQGQLDPLLQA